MVEELASTRTDDTRAQAIVDAAFELFLRFGFRRTSMEDIARAAGMSRPALYLHFRNKDDILRRMVQGYFDRTLGMVQSALQPGLKPRKALIALFEAKAGPEMQAMLTSPHAAELWEANMALCADLVTQGETRIAAALTDWLQGESQAGRIRLAGSDDAAMHADVILGALAGIKDPKRGIDDFQARAKRLAGLLGRALTP